jgi:hypothetical protein
MSGKYYVSPEGLLKRKTASCSQIGLPEVYSWFTYIFTVKWVTWGWNWSYTWLDRGFIGLGCRRTSSFSLQKCVNVTIKRNLQSIPELPCVIYGYSTI